MEGHLVDLVDYKGYFDQSRARGMRRKEVKVLFIALKSPCTM